MTRRAEQLTCWAVTTPGLEAITSGELTALGLAASTAEPGGVEFRGTAGQLVESLLSLRTANRVTVRIASFHARTFAELERHAGAVDWKRWLSSGQAVHFRVTSKKSKLYHEDAIAERLERAAVGATSGVTTVRAPLAVDERERDVTRVPDIQRIIVRVHRDEVTLSADAAGPLLHRRGWRQETAKAPLRETLAAAMLLGCEWNGAAPLVDPLCGAGTVAIEAALLARQMLPGRARRFAAEAWPEIPASLWEQARRYAASRELAQSAVPIGASDRDAGAIRAAIANAERAGVAADITVTRSALSEIASDDGAGWVITNPPYGARIGDHEGLRDLYAALGNTMRTRRPHWSLGFLSAEPRLAGQVGRNLVERFATTNGGIPVRLLTALP